MRVQAWLSVLLLAALCAAEDPFAMFESEPAPVPVRAPSSPDCCAEAARCRRLQSRLGPLRARSAVRRRCPARRPPAVRADRRQVDSAFLRRHVTRTLKLLGLDGDVPPAERETFVLRARITDIQVLRLRQFLAGVDTPLVEVDAILEEVLAESDLESLLTEGRPRWLRWLGPLVSPELLPVLLGGALLLWLLWALLVGRSWSYVLSRLGVLLFLMSFVWHWNHLYRRAQAERHINFRPPAGCEPGDRGWTDGLLHYFRGFVSFTKPDNVCREYYTNLHVDPFSEVSPGMALAETLTKLLLHPAEQLGRGLGRFYSALAAEVPTLWLVPLIVNSLVFILALVVIACRCRPPASRRGSAGSLHVSVAPGQEPVYLVVSGDGEVQPVGEAARRRTTVQSSAPERIGWLTWTGRGLVRSLSAGAAAAGAAAAGAGAALARRPAPVPAVVEAGEEAETELARDPLRVTEVPRLAPRRPPRHTAPDQAAPAAATSGAVAVNAADLELSSSTPALGGGDRGAPDVGTVTTPSERDSSAAGDGDRPRVTDLSGGATPERTDPAGGDAARPGLRDDDVPMTPVRSDPAGGGDAGPSGEDRQRSETAEVAPRGGGDESLELPASPFLTRIKEVMDTSLGGEEG